MEAGTEAQICTSRSVPGRAGLHRESLLQLCRAVGLSGMWPSPRSRPRSQTSGPNSGRQLQGAGLAASALPLGASFRRPHLTLSPQLLLAGRRESWETVPVSYSLGDELSKPRPVSGSPLPLWWNRAPSSSASPTPPPCRALPDTDVMQHSACLRVLQPEEAPDP